MQQIYNKYNRSDNCQTTELYGNGLSQNTRKNKQTQTRCEKVCCKQQTNILLAYLRLF